MKEIDQSSRVAWIAAGLKEDPLAQRVREIDAANTQRLHEIVDQVGWPTITMVGQDGSDASWLLVQHADRDRPFQERCLKLMEPLMAVGEVSKKNVAYLTDRLLVAQKLPQRYGTQWMQVNGDHEPGPIEDPEHLEERRAAAGLETMAQNKERMNLTYGSALTIK